MQKCSEYDLNMLREQIFQCDYRFGVVKKDPEWSKPIITDVGKHYFSHACVERITRLWNLHCP